MSWRRPCHDERQNAVIDTATVQCCRLFRLSATVDAELMTSRDAGNKHCAETRYVGYALMWPRGARRHCGHLD